MHDMQKEIALFKQIENEIMMDTAEMQKYLQSLETDGKGYYVFSEDRAFPIHSLRQFPARWADRKPEETFTGTARPGESYAFQLAIYAPDQKLNAITVTCSGVPGMQCIQTEGVDCWGKPFTKTISVDPGKVQPLWLLISIPEDNDTDVYEGTVTIAPQGLKPCAIGFRISVEGEPIEAYGDNEPWRHGRLRWLNSDIAVDDKITYPFTPLVVKGLSIECYGKKVVLGKNGLPASIQTFYTNSNEHLSLHGRDVLQNPMQFGAALPGEAEVVKGTAFTVKEDGLVAWTAICRQGALLYTVNGRMEYDGYIEYSITVEAEKDAEPEDIALSIPYTKEASAFMMGMGVKGSYRTEPLDWKWNSQYNQDTLWMGSINAGLMVRLKGTDYEKPYMLIYYHYKPLNIPNCWDNSGQGGCRVSEENGRAVVNAYSGARKMQKGEKIQFLFDLSITPVKTINKQEHWRDRYYHNPAKDLSLVSRSTSNIINIHHGNDLNPFINYPFFETERLAEYVQNCHDNSIRVKLYYTIKEMTNHAVEFWAFRSLGEEIMPKTYELGKSFQGDVPYADEWLAKYLTEDFITAWRQRVNNGHYVNEIEASVMHAPMSRFNNYFLEGLDWLLKNTNMDGLYFDDVAFNRVIMKRIRKILDRHHRGCTIDLHSWNYFKNNNVDDSSLAGWGNSMNLYIDNFAFIDRLWFGEGFDYSETPDFWLIEMSGIPFGMMGEMLQNGGNVWRGMLFGMTNRMPREEDSPVGMYRIWDSFGIDNATMLGFWNDECPIKTNHPDVYATVFKKPDKALVSIASWANEPVDVTLDIDFASLGYDPKGVRLTVPAIDQFQDEKIYELGEPITVEAGKGYILILETG